MVSRRKSRGGGVAAAGNETVDEGSAAEVTAPGYEQLRDQRVKENLKRMQKLGIVELSLKLKSTAAASKRLRKNSSEKEPPNGSPADEPPRRSSRLKTLTPISYMELRPKTKSGSSKSNEIHIKEGSQPEVYTEEDAKLLGDCESSWTVGVDGYDQDGKRMYDPINGESCHQCRQKTLGHHTHCSKCKSGQGQLCGDCLYTRYGENVMEVSMNPNWNCPVCRGICNCSLCRQLKGWMPTGAIYRKARNLGFKSVAHYLIQTRGAPLNQKGVGSVDSSQALANQPLERDDSLSSVNIHGFEGKMEQAKFSEK
ncbi:uncharacterized protein LOC111451293 isoform X1 [Cucurbita moschata]|uniref:Uncharacterized protein LOC111451293 isoform X1 n=1 Tax=Cucurbita moschata TaxID=3662 RepID=A0A6J1G6F8_CUCMO|nr:uncharacterized protein LOC111451293 isoform X1 [Cucurbita moschata]